MALSQSALLEVLESLKAADADDVVRSALQVILQELIEAEATSVIGAARHERTDLRTAQRNGHRSRVLTTAAGTTTNRRRPVKVTALDEVIAAQRRWLLDHRTQSRAPVGRDCVGVGFERVRAARGRHHDAKLPDPTAGLARDRQVSGL